MADGHGAVCPDGRGARPRTASLLGSEASPGPPRPRSARSTRSWPKRRACCVGAGRPLTSSTLPWCSPRVGRDRFAKPRSAESGPGRARHWRTRRASHDVPPASRSYPLFAGRVHPARSLPHRARRAARDDEDGSAFAAHSSTCGAPARGNLESALQMYRALGLHVPPPAPSGSVRRRTRAEARRAGNARQRGPKAPPQQLFAPPRRLRAAAPVQARLATTEGARLPR